MAAAVVWAVGATILLARGVAYIVTAEEYEHLGGGIVLIALVAVGIGIGKARVILLRYASRSVRRILTRGRACFFGLFAWSSWAFIVVMMSGGLLLRHSPLVGSWWGRMLLGVLYVAVGTGLAIADVVFWRAALGRPRIAVADHAEGEGLRAGEPRRPPQDGE